MSKCPKSEDIVTRVVAIMVVSSDDRNSPSHKLLTCMSIAKRLKSMTYAVIDKTSLHPDSIGNPEILSGISSWTSDENRSTVAPVGLVFAGIAFSTLQKLQMKPVKGKKKSKEYGFFSKIIRKDDRFQLRG